MTSPSQHQEVRNRVLRQAVMASLGARALGAVALFALTPILTRLLGVEAYGVLMTLTSAGTVLALADFGISNSLVSRIATVGWDSPRTRCLLSSAAVLLVLASSLALTASAALTFLLPWPRWLNAPSLEPTSLRLAALFALVGASLTLTTGMGQKVDLARQRGDLVALWAAGAALSGPTAAVLVAAAGGSLPAVVAAAALMPPMVLGAQTVRMLTNLPPGLRLARSAVRRADILETLRTGGVFLGLAMVMAVAYQVDVLIVSSVLGAVAAAQFSLVVRVFALVGTTIQNSLSQLWSAFAEALGRSDIGWIRHTLVRSSALAGVIALAAGLVLVIFGRRLIGWWVGDELVPTLGLLIAACLWTAYSTLIYPLTMFLNGAQMQKEQLIAAVPMACANIGLSLLLTHEVGTPGPLLGSLFANLVFAGIPLTILVVRRLRADHVAPRSSRRRCRGAVGDEDPAGAQSLP